MNFTYDQQMMIRYIGENTTKTEPSDVNIRELENLNELSWVALNQVFNILKKNKFISGTVSTKSFIELTDSGWSAFNNFIGDTLKVSKSSTKKTVVPKPLIVDESKISQTNDKTVYVMVNDGKSMLVSFDGCEPVRIGLTKINQYRDATEITLGGGKPMTTSQEKWIEKFNHKIDGWDEYPRKDR